VKKPLAILFSLLLVWAQVIFSAPVPDTTVLNTTCTCCACGGTGCCLSESSSSASTPPPAPPVRASYENGVSFSATTSVAWTLPMLDAEEASPSAIGLLKSVRVPLFTRHCALLI
jgi:hypothetical protein